jgi:Chaperone of endosialidase
MKTILTTIVLACFGLLPGAQAVSPPPDGGYAGGNTAEGTNALLSRTTGTYNTAIGIFSLLSLTDGNFCTSVGAGALLANTADENTATGAGALLSNSTGFGNTGNGAFALFNNTTGVQNTATGSHALFSNTGNFGNFNTANGASALFSNTTASNNTADGAAALRNTTTGNNNTANGAAALAANTTGGFNTAIGEGALLNSTGDNNIALGVVAGANLTTGSNNIDIGNRGTDESSTTRIGSAQTRTFISGIAGVTVANGIGVIVGLNGPTGGQLGTTTSSERFKEAIKPMDKASEAILALKPVTFRYKHELDPEGIPQFGLVAEQVEKVNPALVVRDEQGKVYTVRYDAVNAMLLNEFLKEHRKVQEQEATIAQLKKDFRATVAQLAMRLDEQAAQIQKVSTQLEASKPAPHVVNNP